MKYLVYAMSGVLAVLACLSCTHHFLFSSLSLLNTLPIAMTAISAISLLLVRRGVWILFAGGVLMLASILEFVGAFFALIALIFICFGSSSAPVGHGLVDLVILVCVAVLGSLTSSIALGLGVARTGRRSHRNLLHHTMPF